jgi:hypothetical protein
LRELPSWVLPWTAVIGVAIAALGLGITAIQVFGGGPAVPTPIIIKPEAFIDEVTIANDQVTAAGRFRSVEVASEVVLFIGRPVGVDDARWLPVEAVIKPQPSAAGSRVDGLWTAVRPFSDQGKFAWRALVVPAGSGASDAYEDIRLRGPESADVLATSDEFVTGQ